MGQKNYLLANIESIHLLGVGGIGMSGIARILLKKGYHVSGSDIKEGHIVEGLIREGLCFFKGHKARTFKPDLVICSAAISTTNEELKWVISQAIPWMYRRSFLSLLSHQKKRSIAVMGSHGKTTVSGILASLFQGYDNGSFCIGGLLEPHKKNALWTSSDFFCCGSR